MHILSWAVKAFLFPVQIFILKSKLSFASFENLVTFTICYQVTNHWSPVWISMNIADITIKYSQYLWIHNYSMIGTIIGFMKGSESNEAMYEVVFNLKLDTP